MSSVDERIVEMKFKNGQFEKGIAQTSNSLSKFKKDLDLEGAAKGLDGIGKAGSRINLDHIGETADRINSKLSILGVVGATALSQLTSKALTVGASLVKNVLDPIFEGGSRRAQNIEQAKFMLEGLKVAWEDILPAINHAVDGTAYGLDEAAKAASSLTASRVPLEEMGTALRGISGVAAMTNSGYTDIAQVFLTVAGNGRLMASELNRIGARGINAAAALANYLGVTEEAVRDMTSKGEIDFRTFAAAMDSAFGEQATRANETYSGSLANVRSALARIGEPLAAGRMEMLRQIFNSLRVKINDAKTALQPLLDLIKQFRIASGARWASFIDTLDIAGAAPVIQHVVNGLNNLVTAAGKFGSAIAKAWKEAFPSASFNFWEIPTKIAAGFERLTAALIPSENTLNVISNIFTVLFGVVSTVVHVLKTLWSVVKTAFGVLKQLGLLLLDLIAPFFKIEGKASDATGTIGGFFQMLRDGLDKGVKPVIEFLKDMAEGLKNLREGGSSGNKTFDAVYGWLKAFTSNSAATALQMFKNIGSAIADMRFDGSIVQKVLNFFASLDFSDIPRLVKNAFDWLVENLAPIGAFLGNAFMTIFEPVKNILSSITLDDIDKVGRLAANLLVMYQLYKTLKSIRGVIDSASGVFDSISGAINRFNQESKSTSFLKVAIGVGILVGALWLLTTVPVDKLWHSVGAIASIMAIMVGVIFGLQLISKKMGEEGGSALKTAANTILTLAFAVGVLALSVWMLSKIDAWGLVRGLTAIMLILWGLAGAVALMLKLGGDKTLLKVGMALFALSSSLLLLALAIKIFDMMEWDDIANGLAKMSFALFPLVLALYILGKNAGQVAVGAAAILALAVSTVIMAGALKLLAGMDEASLIKGVLTITALLGAMVGAMILVTRNAGKATIGIATILAITASIFLISEALRQLTQLDQDDMVNSATTLSMVAIILGGVAATLAKHGKNALLGGASFAMMAASILIIAGALKLMADVPVGAIVGMSAIIILLIGVIWSLKAAMSGGMKDMIVGAAMFVVLAGSLLIVAAALKMVSDIPFTAVLVLGAALLVLVAAFAAVVIIANKFAIGMLLIIGAILALSVLVGSIALVVWAMSGLVDAFSNLIEVAINAFERFGPALTGVGIGLENLSGSLDSLSWGSIGKIAALIAVGFGFAAIAVPVALGAMGLALAFKIVAEAMETLSAHGDKASEVIPKIIRSITDLTDGFADTAAFAIKLGVLSGALLPFGVAMISLAEGMRAMSNAAKDVDTAGIDNLTSAITTLIDGLMDAFDGTSIFDFTGLKMKDVADGLKPLAEAFQTVKDVAVYARDAESDIESLGSVMTSFLSMLDTVFNSGWDTEGLTSESGNAMKAVGDGLKPLAEAFQTVKETAVIATNVDGDITSLKVVMNNFLGMLDEVFKNSFWDSSGGLTSESGGAMEAVATGLAALAETFKAVKETAVEADGTKEQVDQLAEAMDAVFTTLKDAFNTSWFDGGLTEGSGKAMESVGKGLKDLSTTFKAIKDLNGDDKVTNADVTAFTSKVTLMLNAIKELFVASSDNSFTALTEETGKAMGAVGDGVKKIGTAMETVQEVANTLPSGSGGEATTKLKSFAANLKELFTVLKDTMYDGGIGDTGLSQTTGEGLEAVGTGLSKVVPVLRTINNIAEEIANSDGDVGATIDHLKNILDKVYSVMNDQSLSKSDGETMVKLSEGVTKLSDVVKKVVELSTTMADTEGSASSIENFQSIVTQLFETLDEDALANLDANAMKTKLTTVGEAISAFIASLKEVSGNETEKFTSIATGIDNLRTAVSEDLGTSIGTALESVSQSMTDLQTLISDFSTSIGTIGTDISTAAGSVGGGFDTLNSALTTGISGMSSSITTAGTTVASSFSTGVSQGSLSVRMSGAALVLALVGGITSSNSSLTNTGSSMTKTIAAGVTADTSTMKSAGATLVSDLVTEIKNKIPEQAEGLRASGSTLGSAIVEGMARGIANGSSSVTAQIRATARAAISAAQSELDINSPSRKFAWIGAMMSLGQAQGYDSNADKVVSSVEDLGLQAIRSMRESVRNLNDLMEINPDMSPRIRPVLDLSDVERNAGRIGDLMSTTPIRATVSAGMAQSHAATLTRNSLTSGEQSSSGNGDTVFNQYNYSPKALSTTEVYRQTSNLVSRAKKAGEND